MVREGKYKEILISGFRSRFSIDSEKIIYYRADGQVRNVSIDYIVYMYDYFNGDETQLCYELNYYKEVFLNDCTYLYGLEPDQLRVDVVKETLLQLVGDYIKVNETKLYSV
jgi:hypothetical protein